jgi:xylulokinase
MYLLGYDIGSSSIKAVIIDAATGANSGFAQSPTTEMAIAAPQTGWAEQSPETWWEHVCAATKKILKEQNIDPPDIKGIGISYQMHGLVVVDKNQRTLRPSIIWCDSRAVETGNRAFDEIGHQNCLANMLNSPGNFTASKLRWVKDHEPHIYQQIHKMMLPGDYIAMRLTGEIVTTPGGLSESILWDFRRNDISSDVLRNFGIGEELIPEVKPTFSIQGVTTQAAARDTGLRAGIPVAYRAGDQPNNALSLNVLQPGEIAATGGTSGVIYSVVDKLSFDEQSRVNSFAHVNHTKEKTRIGILLCINGSGIQYAWVRHRLTNDSMTYREMEKMAAEVPVGSDGLCMLPFGNGAERMLGNRNLGARIANLHFNLHHSAHFFRAALEGIAFSFVYGVSILKELGLNVGLMRVGNDNLFQSEVFSDTISTLLGCTIQVIETTGAIGAAKAAGVATGIYPDVETAVKQMKVLKTYIPGAGKQTYEHAYRQWEHELNKLLAVGDK